MAGLQEGAHPVAAGSFWQLERDCRFLQLADQRPARKFISNCYPDTY